MSPFDSPQECSALHPATQNAVDQLWKFQLRKENKALLEKYEESLRASQAIVAKYEKKAVEINQLAERIDRLEGEVDDFYDTIDEKEKALRGDLQDLKTNITKAPKARSLGLAESHMPEEIESTTMPRASIDVSSPPLAPPVSKILQPKTRSLIRASAAEANLTTTKNIKRVHKGKKSSTAIPRVPITRTQNKTKDQALDVTPSQRSRSKSGSASAFKVVFASRLFQGPGSIAKYYQKACEIHEAFPGQNYNTEIEFVGAFIKGLSGVEDQEALIGELRQLFPSRQSNDGRTEVLCHWDEVEVGLVRADLMVATNSTRKVKRSLAAEDLMDDMMRL